MFFFKRLYFFLVSVLLQHDTLQQFDEMLIDLPCNTEDKNKLMENIDLFENSYTMEKEETPQLKVNILESI
jgi:hypothetical protein